MSNWSKTLYVVRHAKSSWKDLSLSDHDRPLNKRGRRASPDMGKRMAAQGHRPDLIISSTARRALSTAQNIAVELGIRESEIVTDRQLYFNGTRGMINALASVDDQVEKVMMVGHNPTVTDLINTLSNGSLYDVPTCAIAIIGFDMTSWSQVSKTQGELVGYDYPKGSGSFLPANS